VLKLQPFTTNQRLHQLFSLAHVSKEKKTKLRIIKIFAGKFPWPSCFFLAKSLCI
jgi:hypothetical protein